MQIPDPAPSEGLVRTAEKGPGFAFKAMLRILGSESGELDQSSRNVTRDPANMHVRDPHLTLRLGPLHADSKAEPRRWAIPGTQ